MRNRDGAHASILYATYRYNPSLPPIRWLRNTHKIALCQVLREYPEPLDGHALYVASVLLSVGQPLHRSARLKIYRWTLNEDP